jgi:hypothetical protein
MRTDSKRELNREHSGGELSPLRLKKQPLTLSRKEINEKERKTIWKNEIKRSKQIFRKREMKNKTHLNLISKFD